MSGYKSNPELKDIDDRELLVRLGILYKIVYDNLDDSRVANPLSQMETLLAELLARKVVPVDQVISLSTLKMEGEVHTI